MKKIFSVFLMSIMFLNIVSAASAKDSSLLDRAAHEYNSTLQKTQLNVTKNDKLTTTNYKSIYIPVKDVFKNSGTSIKWDNKKKITTLKKNGSELILNFSGKKISATKNQVLLPQEWIQLKKGVSSINAFVLAYIFDEYADDSDSERIKWMNQLEFLDIKKTSGIGGVDGAMHVFVEFQD